MSTAVSKSLKLEDQCLLHLICHLEDYLPETLALLPLHLRRRLLLNLPVADVCQLENTAVSSGIDIEGSIWKVLRERYARRYASELRDPDNPEHLKKYIFTLMWQNKGFDLQRAKTMLFSVQDCLGVTNWDGILHGFAPIGTGEGHLMYPTPYRYVKYFSEECPELDLMSFLVNNCQWMPAHLLINSKEFQRSQLWSERHTRRCRNIMQRFLSQVQEVSSTHTIGRVCRFILEEILNNHQTALRRLKFQIPGIEFSSGHSHLAAVAPLFSSSGSSDGGPPHSHPNIPYSKLSSIAVNVQYGCCIPKSVDTPLQAMISYQKALSSVELFTDSDSAVSLLYRPSVPLLSILGSLFHQPQFRELSLGHMSMYQNQLDALLSRFLSAPSGEHEQALTLVNVVFRGIRAPREDVGSEPTHEGTSLSTPENSSPDVDTSSCTCGVSRLPRKALTLRSSLKVQLNGLWLSAFNCSSLLSSLTVEGSECCTPFSLCHPNYRATMLQHLRLYSVTFEFQPFPHMLFSSVFEGPNLKTVHLINCSIGKDGLLPALTQGLRRQILVGSLEDLSLERNDLGTSPDPELQEFFDVLFSLPQLSNLQVNLKFNCFQPNHFFVMCKSWKKKCGRSERKLKALMVHEKLCDLNTAVLRQMSLD